MSALLRIVNGIRKVAAGLRPFNESVWPGVRNDLFVAHESIYRFFARFAEGRDVLDAGCGTGYGTFALSRAARSVVGVDIDGASVRYAARHYRAPNLRFMRADLEKLVFDGDAFDVVVSSNALEHLAEPAAFISTLRRIVRANGTAIVAVPPIITAADHATHADIPYHRSNLTVREWHSLFAAEGAVQCYLHRAANVQPDFSSPRASRLSADDFAFDAVDLERFFHAPAITAVFVLKLP